MSVYSIARFQHLRPSPPFLMGGQFWREGERCFLSNATIRFELSGPLSTLNHGDLVTVQVTAIKGLSIECDKANSILSGKEAKNLRQGSRSAEFAGFVRQIRDFFVKRGLVEIFTPTLVTCPGLEPHLEPFSVEISKGRETRTVYLPTSPEIHLKKAMTRGWTDIFEIKTCFRKGEFSPHHANEFHMLEWYRGFADLESIIEDLGALLSHLQAGQPRQTSFANLFKDILGFELKPATTALELRELCERESLHQLEDESFNDLFHRLLIDRIEPKFKEMGPLIVRDFPPSQAALAKLNDRGWADRFEFYWRGLEIANAFNEVNDPDEQIKRWQIEQDERMHLGTSDVPDDPELISDLRRGMPPAGGIALGVERLFMACRGVSDIRDLALFSSEDLF